jgi:two-component system, LytTR family, response regulator
MALQVIIVDDESSARDRVRDLLAEEADVAIAAECSSGREAIATITALRPDLLFLDIQMPKVNGFDVLRALPAKNLPVVIFTTAYDQHALEAFEVHALDYFAEAIQGRAIQSCPSARARASSETSGR